MSHIPLSCSPYATLQSLSTLFPVKIASKVVSLEKMKMLKNGKICFKWVQGQLGKPGPFPEGTETSMARKLKFPNQVDYVIKA